jgi:hypothetical protein
MGAANMENINGTTANFLQQKPEIGLKVSREGFFSKKTFSGLNFGIYPGSMYMEKYL